MTVLCKATYAATTASSVYTNSALSDKGQPVNVVIDYFTAHNNDTADHPLQAYIVPNGAAVDTSCCVMDVMVTAKQSWLCADLVGAELSPGDSIYFATDTASMISLNGAGRRRLDAL